MVVTDVESAMRWYRQVLNFRRVSERVGINGLPIEAHLWRTGGPSLVLRSAAISAPEARRHTRLRFLVDEDLEAVALRAAALGAQQVSGTPQQPGAGRELVLLDPDGHELTLLNTGAAP